MQGTDEMRDRLVNEFAENYMEKLFYFCLKKTGNNAEAEDLTQDIAYQIIASLNNGTVPASFHGWVWQIARNRYSAWAKRKHDRAESVTGSDIGDYEIADGDESVLDKMIHTEQMALLRRELAFIKSDYRDIVVAYYIEDKKVSVIASDLSLPVNTVKSRLLRAREILKEGMDMARTFGKRSYAPEDINIASSGPQPNGLPDSAIRSKISKNILLEASNNPSTIEELSVELGIALPYMEEEVENLYNATLLAKQGDKYVTNFFIMGSDCKKEVYSTLRKEAKERSRLLREFIDDRLGDIRALGIAGEHIDDNTLRWWLVPNLIDRLITKTNNNGDTWCAPKRANGDTWGVVGYESFELPESTASGQNGCGNGQNMFWAYTFMDYNMGNQCGTPEYEEAMLLMDCIRNNRKAESFSEIDKNIWDGIDGLYAHLAVDGRIIPDVIVLTDDILKKIYALFEGDPNYAALIHNTTDAYNKIESIFKKNSHKVLHDSLSYYIRMEMTAMRMMAVHDLVESGLLKLADDPAKSTLGMYIVLK